VKTLTGRFIGVALTLLLAANSRAVTLEECIMEALQQNPDLNAAMYRVEAAAASVGEVRSTWYPTITLSGQYTRTDNPPQAFFMNLNQRTASMDEDFNHPGDTDNFRTSAGFRMLVADGGRRSLSTRIAQLNESAARDMLSATQNELVFQVTRAYYTVKQSASLIQVHEETVGRIKRSLDVARDRHIAGAVLKTDVLNLEVQEAEAQENLIRAQNQFQLALAALHTAIGKELINDPSAERAPENFTLDPPPDHILSDEWNERPERLSARRQAEAASLDVRRAGRDRLPRLHAFGSVDWDSDTFSDTEQSYFVGAAVEWDIFTGFRRDATAAAARARHAEALAREKSLVNQLRLDVRNAHLNSQDAWARLDVVAKAVHSAAEVQRITGERYEQGAADITELLAANNQLTSALQRNTSVRYDYRISLADLNRARGLLVHSASINPGTPHEK